TARTSAWSRAARALRPNSGGTSARRDSLTRQTAPAMGAVFPGRSKDLVIQTSVRYDQVHGLARVAVRSGGGARGGRVRGGTAYGGGGGGLGGRGGGVARRGGRAVRAAGGRGAVAGGAAPDVRAGRGGAAAGLLLPGGGAAARSRAGAGPRRAERALRGRTR